MAFTKSFIVNKDPKVFLRTQIIKGDRSDGVPNILSDDDIFVRGKDRNLLRQNN